MIQVKVAQIAVDQKNTPIVLLKEVEGDRILPIWIAPPEAAAIAMGLTGQKFERPLTHDLLKQVITGLGATLERVVITRIENRTYYAQLQLVREANIFHVDARPSDSIALALRLDAPLFADDSIMKDSSFETVEGPVDPGDLSPEDLKSYLKDLDPEDLGKFNP